MGLLEYAACDDLPSFQREIEEKGLDLDEPGLWYCKKLGSNKMGLEQRTPLMVAATYGSKKVLTFILSTGKSDVNRACGEERVTALHCAVAGCSVNMVEVINALLDASAFANAVDANGNQALDLFVRVSRFLASPTTKKAVEMLLRGGGMMINEAVEEEEEEVKIVSKYPADASLPDINEGVYGSDEFRMYSFKVKPCSRAYSHDWTECAFVHPGENARRRDPRKYPYTCVPCPEFRKGSCPKGDSCEYAHGVFESWLHPAQYKTRLCKDETGCARKVCFFAHRREEMRPVNASTGSAVSQSPLEMMNGLSPLAYSSSGVSTRPVSPMGGSVGSSSPRNGGSWQNRVNALSPPTLQLNGGSRLKSTLSARDMDLDMEMELRLRGFNNVEETFGSYVSSPSRNSQMGQNMNQHYPSSPVRQQPPPPHHFDSSAAVAAAVMNARSSAFAKQRSLSFKPQVASTPSNLSDWGSPSGKLDWGVQGDELSKMRRSVSFGIRGDNNSYNAGRDYRNEPDVSWVNSLVKDSVVSERGFGMNERVRIMSWAEQMYREKEQTVV